MSVARVVEISATSSESFDDAVKQGIERANQTLRHVEGAWVKEQNVMIHEGQITNYKVNLLVTFLLEGDSGHDAHM
jgi:dodecin